MEISGREFQAHKIAHTLKGDSIQPAGILVFYVSLVDSFVRHHAKGCRIIIRRVTAPRGHGQGGITWLIHRETPTHLIIIPRGAGLYVRRWSWVYGVIKHATDKNFDLGPRFDVSVLFGEIRETQHP